jgi:NADPH-dependent curcumin reductase CurA
MRGRMTERKSYIPAFELGKPLEGVCVGKIIDSKNHEFTPGDYVLGTNGWREYWISDGSSNSGVSKIDPNMGPIHLPRNIWDDRTHGICRSVKNWPTQRR